MKLKQFLCAAGVILAVSTPALADDIFSYSTSGSIALPNSGDSLSGTWAIDWSPSNGPTVTALNINASIDGSSENFLLSGFESIYPNQGQTDQWEIATLANDANYSMYLDFTYDQGVVSSNLIGANDTGLDTSFSYPGSPYSGGGYDTVSTFSTPLNVTAQESNNVPEPASVALMLTGIVLLGATVAKRRK